MPDTEQHAEFALDTMQSMIDALTTTGRVLRLSDREPGLAGVATKKIIELAKASERAVERVRAAGSTRCGIDAEGASHQSVDTPDQEGSS